MSTLPDRTINLRARMGLAACAFALALGLSACSPQDAETVRTDPAAPHATQSAGSAALAAGEVLVSDIAAFEAAAEDLQPGGTIVLADGEWADFEILLTGQGTTGAPITLRAQTPGRVILTGQSNLRLAGEHLVVDGLVFRDGYTPTSSVIEFRRNSRDLANNSVVRNTVIDGFSNPERYENDNWVLMYGKNNRFENNHLEGKGNLGVTLAVRLNTEDSQENGHVIASNYFGPRPMLGSNGGETLRVGTSHHSLSDSLTIIENNVFDRANGELEIVSIKSGRNELRGNTFLGARGTLTMRHGNNNIIEDNVFLGQGGDHTGGIRVINAGHQVRNNYMEDLSGIRFGGAFTIMNGVPDSPINRYHQVKDAVIENNSILNTNSIQLGAGSDSERSATPEDTTFANNLVAPNDPANAFAVYDDVSGIDFNSNVILGADTPDFTDGFARQDIELTRAANGLLYPPAGVEAGVSRDLAVTQLSDVGVDWYPKAPAMVEFGSGREVAVAAEEGALFTALQSSAPGDVLVLAPGEHNVRKILFLTHPVTLRGAGPEAVTLTFERSALAQIENGGSLRLEGLTISGREAPDMAGNAMIRTSPYAMTQNYRLEIADTVVEDLDVNRFFDVVRGAKSTLADHIRVTDSEFREISGTVFNFVAERDDLGRYNAEYVEVDDSVFENIQGPLAALYRGGRDESTFGPHFRLEGSTVTNVGAGSRNTLGTSLWLHGVQDTDIRGSVFTDSPAFKIDHTVGEPQTDIAGNTFSGVTAPVVVELTSGLPPQARITGNQGLAR